MKYIESLGYECTTWNCLVCVGEGRWGWAECVLYYNKS